MNYITTTKLRTQSAQLVHTLKKGGVVSLIHRSKIVGFIQPTPEAAKLFDAEKFESFIKGLNLPSTTPAQRKKLYTAQLRKKYGQTVS